MTDIKAVIFDLDNTLLDRSSTFKAFAISFLQHYFGHLESRQLLLGRIKTAIRISGRCLKNCLRNCHGRASRRIRN
ncbi:hypothetical protein [Candidatus Pristimantibacillus sp. PTI5]|uniref:hypothetical protein n=1 Tax=Candidatus Pristimantibacillus sp. PTI5 TaxID=3400422 RepID=UPI003B025414